MNPLEALSKSMNQIEITLTNPVAEVVDEPVEADIEEVVEDVEDVGEDNAEQPPESSVQKEIEDSKDSKDTLLDITQTIIEKETSLDIQKMKSRSYFT